MSTIRMRDGIVAGLIAGMAMAMIAMPYALVTEGDLLAPLKQMGALLVPHDGAPVASLLAGMTLHLMTAAVLGVLFVIVARAIATDLLPFGTIPMLPAAVAGMVYTVVEWIIASFLILPAIHAPVLATFATIGGFVAHATYGIVLGWWLASRAAPAAVHVHMGRAA